MSEQQSYAVLTGDLVKSSKLTADQLAAAVQVMRDAIPVFTKTYSDSIVGTIDVFRGDGWQVLVKKPELALRLALFLRAKLIAAETDSKVSIAHGAVDRIVEERISESVGNAFEKSGRGLDKLKKWQCLIADNLNAEIFLLDALIQNWTAKTAEAISGALLGKTQDEIAEESDDSNSRQNIAKALHRGSWGAISLFLEEIEGKLV